MKKMLFGLIIVVLACSHVAQAQKQKGEKKSSLYVMISQSGSSILTGEIMRGLREILETGAVNYSVITIERCYGEYIWTVCDSDGPKRCSQKIRKDLQMPYVAISPSYGDDLRHAIKIIKDLQTTRFLYIVPGIWPNQEARVSFSEESFPKLWQTLNESGAELYGLGIYYEGLKSPIKQILPDSAKTEEVDLDKAGKKLKEIL